MFMKYDRRPTNVSDIFMVYDDDKKVSRIMVSNYDRRQCSSIKCKVTMVGRVTSMILKIMKNMFL